MPFDSVRSRLAHSRAREVSETLPKPDKIDRLLAPVYPAMALMAGMQLEIFTAIAGGAHTTD